jgi:hypothetical protein
VSVFVDTSALYALLVATEEGHADIAAAFRGLLESGRVLRSTNYVLVETIALLQHRFGLPPVRDLEARIVPLLGIRWVDEGLHRRAAERHRKRDQRRLSLVDCVSFVVMDDEGIRDALALAPDFGRHGYTLIPGATGAPQPALLIDPRPKPRGRLTPLAVR